MLMLQCRYLAVNYDRREFTIAQASFPAGNDERDVVVYHHRSRSRLSRGTVVGICIGVIAAVVIVLGRIAWLLYQRRKEKQRRWGSLGGKTVNDQSDDLGGWMKPLESDTFKSDDVKPELDANATARGVSAVHRAELCADEGVLRANSKQRIASEWGDQSPPVELDGAETLVGQPSPAVSPLQSSEISLTPLPHGHPSPAEYSASSSRGRRPSLGRLKSFFHELQASSGDQSPSAEQKKAAAERVPKQAAREHEESPEQKLGSEK